MGLTACSLHPGAVMGSELSRDVSMGLAQLPFMLMLFGNPVFWMHNMKSLDQGAATTLRCVSLADGELKGGHWYMNCQSGRDNNQLRGASVMRNYDDFERESLDVRLWQLTETLITQKGFELEL